MSYDSDVRAPTAPSSFTRSSVAAVFLTLTLTAAAPPAAVSAQAASEQASERRPLTGVDLVSLPSISDPRLSPDGGQVLYVRSDPSWEENEDISHIWRVDLDGSNAIQLTSGEEGQRSPRWSPDGSRIAFLANRDEEEDTQVYLLSNSGGEATVLTRHPTSVSDIQWSPDGGWIYFRADDEKTKAQKRREKRKDDVYAFDESYQHSHVWRVAVASGDTERITGGEFSVTGYALSADGGRMVLHRSPSPLLNDIKKREIWVMAADGGDMTRLTSNDVPEYDARLSPDGSRVLFRADSDEDFDFYYNDKPFVVSADGGPAERLLTDLPYEVSSAEWSGDGSWIYFVANTGVRRDMFRVAVEVGAGTRESEPMDGPGASRVVERLTEGDHEVGSWHYRPGLDAHVVTIRSPVNAGDVFYVASSGEPHQVSHVYDHLSEEYLLPSVEAVTWEGEDGVTVEGLVWYPLEYDAGTRYPLVVQTHGGPASSDRFTFPSAGDFVHVLTAHGYMVFQPNYRGSTGYGDDFLRNMVGHYFDQAHKDVMTGVDALIERGMADGERMAKMGWSAGGHMTNKIITYTDRFRAAASGAGAANWISMYSQSDIRVYRTPWFGGSPWQPDAPIDQYLADSPITEVSKVATPTIFLVGENDPRVPMPQSVEMYRGLKANGVPTHLYVAPREQHGWRELRHQLFRINVQMEWFERWVMEREWEWEEAPDGKAGKTSEEGGARP